MNLLITALMYLGFFISSVALASNQLSADGFRRQPFDSPVTISANWDVRDREGDKVDFERITGRSTVVVLFRGHGCYHCVQQLDELTKVESRFKSRGIRLVAISDESVKVMDSALIKKPMPFPVFSDINSKMAKSLGSERVENWHGILLLDSNGKARWLLSGSRPLMDFREVLSQIDRLRLSSKPILTHQLGPRQLSALGQESEDVGLSENFRQ